MSYFENVNIAAQDSPTIDAFARLRVSEPRTLFDSKQISGPNSPFWDLSLSGTATSAYSQDDARTRLSVTTSGDRAIRRTITYHNYQPGKSQLMFITFKGSQDTNVSKQIGLFDNLNGIIFEINGSTKNFKIRKAGSDTETVEQANWNNDKFDGTGPSGVTLDLNQAQILYIDYEWLGVGRVRCGFVIDGIPYVAHSFNHANISGFPSVYMSTPNLPINYEIISTGGSGYLDSICSTVISEGGVDDTGITFSVNVGANTANSYNITTPGRIKPVILMRLRNGLLAGDDGYDRTSVKVDVEKVNIMCSTGANYLWQIHGNVTIDETVPLVWQVADPRSAIEYALCSTTGANNLFTNSGTVYDSGYSSNNQDSVPTLIKSTLSLGKRIDGTRIVGALSIGHLAGNETYWPAITWREFL
jgi:hypothetical protein